ncbi:Bug1p [Saccharomyces eubayanus]|uniref:Bug1p n=1 Tax=Saccharomyces eubayanus TaxID=1080349 RepID=UPI0006C3176F|nr:BUG1-like protein [Saccharomyces eubayanus]KOH00270.1 BUG1-like protein [Saccharomyces eubayanus]
MSEQDAEAKRAKQLEEARKRVEELKKKKNKKGKGKKNKNNNVTGTTGSDTPEVESTPGEELPQEQTPVVDSTKSENEPEHVEENEENEEEEELEENEELAASNDSGVNEEETKVEDEPHASVEEENSENVKKEEDQEILSHAENNKTIGTAPVVAEEPKEVRETSHSSAEADDLFGGDDNEESDFLTTIEKQREEDELSKLRTELETLIQENKQLKFLSMDNETTIDDLQEQLQERDDTINSLQYDLQTTRDELTATQQRLREAETKSVRTTTASPVHFADFNSNSTSSKSAANFAPMARGNHAEVDRVMLDKWRNWNVDMTGWRSIGSGPIMEF